MPLTIRPLTYLRKGLIALTCVALLLCVVWTPFVSSGSSADRHAVYGAAAHNVLVILVDDLDERSFEQLLAGNKLPNIKRFLIDKGMRFDNSFVSDSTCCPSRATFFTGQYAHNHQVKSYGGDQGGYLSFHSGNKINRPTVATWLNASYYTGYIGKYMNGYSSAQAIPPGWDYWSGLDLGSIDSYGLRGMRYKLVQRDQPGAAQIVVTPDVYQTKYFGDLAEDFLNNSALNWSWANAAHADRPFFLVIAPLAPHALTEDLNAATDYAEIAHGEYPETDSRSQWTARVIAERANIAGVDMHYNGYAADLYSDSSAYDCAAGYPAGCLRAKLSDGSPDPDGVIPLAGFDLPSYGTPRFNESACNEKPSWVCQYWADAVGADIDYWRRTHLDRLEAMLSIDAMIGQVLNALDAQGALDNTLIIFTSDNGFMLGEHRLGNKQSPYEEAIRVPLVIRTPGSSTQPAKKTNSELVANIDWAPTILVYAGLPWESAIYNIDGRSLKPLLEGNNSFWRQAILIEHWNKVTHGVRSIRWVDVPDYFAVRTADVGGQIWGNSLYVQYDDPDWHGSPFAFLEHYKMSVDPNQRINFSDSSTGSNVLAQTFLDWMLKRLKTCVGDTCRKVDHPFWTTAYFPILYTAKH